MRLSRSCIAAAIASIAILASAANSQAAESKPQPFRPGETLNYDVNWAVFPAGKITATLSRDKDGPDDAFLVTTTANSQGFVSLLYNVRDEFQSVFNPQTLCSIKILKQINEGAHHRMTKITFDRYRGLAILDEHYLGGSHKPPKHDEHKIPPCAQDIVTAFYYVRSQSLHVGQNMKLAINDGKKTKTVIVAVTGQTKIKTPLGEHQALRVVPSVFGNLYQKEKGKKVVIWFSDDAYHFPLRIKVSLKLGTVTGTLTSVSPAPPGYAPPGKPEGETKPTQSTSRVK